MSSSKNEKHLLAKIRDQEEELNRYKKRFRDVVTAHKKLIIEKEHLEESLKIISSHKETYEKNTQEEYNQKNIDKLAQSLSFLSNEKNEMEVQFQNERKYLVQQNTQLEEKLRSLSLSIENSKTIKPESNLESQQKELELLSNLRELQNLLDEERNRREEKEIFIEELKNNLKETEEKLNKCKESENQLRNHIASLNGDSSHGDMEKLKKEIEVLKEQYNFAVQQEQIRAYKAEERNRKLTAEHENRVSKLEQKLSQFSDLAINYDKHRQEDKQTIMKLKNRLMQLELENSNNKSEDDRFLVNEEALLQQLLHIKHQLISNYKTTSQLNKFKDILLKDIEYDDEDELNQLREKYATLKDQFDDLVNKINKNKNNDELAILRQKIHSLNTKIFELESIRTSLEEELSSQSDMTDRLIEKEQQVWKSKMNVLDAEYRSKITIMEQELEKQRKRINNILEDKEKQLVNLQQLIPSMHQLSDETSTRIVTENSELTQSNSSLIYYMEDTARKEVKINKLRKINNELQIKIHNMEQEHFRQIQMYYQLQEDNQRLKKNQDGTEEVNIQYLKNVFYNYLITGDIKMRSHMLNAIFTVLKFTDLEMNRILKTTKLIKS